MTSVTQTMGLSFPTKSVRRLDGRSSTIDDEKVWGRVQDSDQCSPVYLPRLS